MRRNDAGSRSEQVSEFDDTSTIAAFADASNTIFYDAPVARPQRLNEEQRILWKAYRDAYQRLSEVLGDQLVRDAGLSGSEYGVLVVLSYAPGGVMRARDICSELAWDRSRLS